jgi:Secretion system C-terminal sorting domain
MKKIYFLLVFLTLNSFSQNFQWVNFPNITYSFNPSLIGYTTTCDNSGNVYVVGFKDNYFSSSDVYGNLFYRKYDSNGQLLFDKTIGGKVRVFNMTSDNVGNIYVSASFKSLLTFDTVQITSGTTETGVLLKFDVSGNIIFNEMFSNLGISDKNSTALSVDIDNNVYIGIDDFFNSKIIKLSPTGTLLMTIDQLNVKVLSSVSVDNMGNIYASGSCAQSNSKFAGVLQPTSLNYSTYIVKYLSTGVHQWTKFIQDISCLDPIVTAKTPDNIYVSAALSGAYAFGNLTSQGPSSGASDDIYITKLNSTGNFEWIREVQGSGKAYIGNRNFLTSDVDGNVYFTGSTKGATVWTPIISTTISGNNPDALVLKYNSNGDLLFAKTAGGSSSDRSDGIAIDTNGNIYVSGMVYGNSTFGTLTNSSTGNTPLIAKIGNNLKINSFESEAITVYPNPVQTEIFIANINEKSKGIIQNILGQTIKSFELSNNKSIDVSELSNGVFFIKIEGKKCVRFLKD